MKKRRKEKLIATTNEEWCTLHTINASKLLQSPKRKKKKKRLIIGKKGDKLK